MIQRLPTESKLITQLLNEAAELILSVGSQIPEEASGTDFNRLALILQRCNENLTPTLKNPDILQGKSPFVKQISTELEKALQAVHLFEMNQTNKGMHSSKNEGGTILAIFHQLRKEMKKFSKNLKELKEIRDYRLGQKIEQASKGKKF